MNFEHKCVGICTATLYSTSTFIVLHGGNAVGRDGQGNRFALYYIQLFIVGYEIECDFGLSRMS